MKKINQEKADQLAFWEVERNTKQHTRRNNIEIVGMPENVEDNSLEDKNYQDH